VDNTRNLILKAYWKANQKLFVLVYGNKTPEETIFSKELHDLQLQYVGRLFIHFVLAKAENALFGRIDKSVNYVQKHKELEFDKFYCVGQRKWSN
jgi:ring-1,2-phenylacetyl-CoA epoxidase subunit PaaE